MLNTNHPRERLVNTAARLVHRQGWTATGINQILSDANIPKGSFYYYFRSKEALGVAVLQLHAAQIRQLLERTLLNTQLNTTTALDEFVRETIQLNRETEFKLGCPVGSFANEIANQSPQLLTEANHALAQYEEAFISLIQRGQKDGSVPPSVDPVETGKTVAMLFQGAYLAMKCASSVAPIELAHNSARSMIYGSTAAQARREPEFAQNIQALAS